MILSMPLENNCIQYFSHLKGLLSKAVKGESALLEIKLDDH